MILPMDATSSSGVFRPPCDTMQPSTLPWHRSLTLPNRLASSPSGNVGENASAQHSLRKEAGAPKLCCMCSQLVCGPQDDWIQEEMPYMGEAMLCC